MVIPRNVLMLVGFTAALIGQIILKNSPAAGIATLGISLAALLIDGWFYPKRFRAIGFAAVAGVVLGLAYWREPRGWFFMAMGLILAGTSLRAPRQAAPEPEADAPAAEYYAPAAETAAAAQPNYLMAVLYGLAAAVAAAVGWWKISDITGWNLGIVAWGVGRLVGWAVKKGAGDQGNTALQVTAAVLGGLGITGGYYLMVRSALMQVVLQRGISGVTEWKVAQMIVLLVKERPDLIGPMGVLFIAIGIYDAWRNARVTATSGAAV